MNEMTGLEFEIRGNTVTAHRAIEKVRSSLKKLSPETRSSSKSMNLFRSTMQRAIAPITGFAKKLGTVAAAFKRILFYRMIRSVIREITEGFSEGIKNLYGWSQMADGRFAASMDRMATSMLYFKNSVGAAVAPLLNALAPALDYLIDKMVAFINVINQLFAKLTGASYWTKANKVATQYADNASAAGSAAKEALRYLAPFDELNVLPADRGRGGGGGASGTDYSGMFETREAFNQEITNFVDMLKEAWTNGDWEDVGRFLGDKINGVIDGIDWGGIGTNVGKSINALFGIQYWTLDEINFTNLGNKIAEFFNNAISHVDWDIAGRLPVKKLTSVIDTIIGFLGGLDWGQIGRAISDFIKGAFNEGTDWFQSKDFVAMGQNLFNNLLDFLKNVDWNGIANSINTFLWEAIKAVLGLGWGFADALAGAMFGEDQWGAFKAKTHNFVANIWNSLVDDIKEKAPKLADWLNLDYMDTVEIPVTANLTGAKDSIPESQKNISGATAYMTYWKNNLTTSPWAYGTAWFNKYQNTGDLTSGYGVWSYGKVWYNTYQNYFKSKPWAYASAYFNTGYARAAGGGWYQMTKATGGLYKNGSWSDIASYASGGMPHPSQLFIAREAGPELVGTIGGHTAVMNNDQIVASVSAGVAKAISGMEFHLGGISAAPMYDVAESDIDYDRIAKAIVDGITQADISNDTYIDGEAIYRSVRKHNDMNTRMTGVNAFA